MPKTFRLFVACLVFSTLGLFLSGCRTTTSKLASVPGFGWMDRNEEGWAGYEPAPSLPRPSSASEPTGSDSTSNASNIASTSPTTKTFPHLGSSPLSSPKSSEEVARVDPRYAPKGTATAGGAKRNTASTYGDYASAYGKYGPPKSLSSSTSDGVKPQQGPYRAGPTPNYASSMPGGSTQGYGAFGGSESAASDDMNALDASNLASSGRTSRFESSVTTPASASPANWSNDSQVAANDSSYVPPGFITKPKPSSLATVPKHQLDADRSGGASRAAEYLAAAPDGAPAARPHVGSRAATGAPSSANSLPNRFGSAGQQRANSLPVSGSNPASFGAADPAGEVVNNFVSPNSAASNRFGAGREELEAAPANTATVPGSRFQGSGSFAAPAASSTGGGFGAAAPSGTPHASLGQSNRFTASPANRGGETAEQTANGYLDAIGGAAGASRQAASHYLSGETPRDVGPLPGSTPAAPLYPSTSTPHGYLDSAAPATESPSSSPSSIRRSSTPFRPGSTSSFQSSLRTTRKAQVTLDSSHRLPDADQLVLAVGDKFQFPRTLR